MKNRLNKDSQKKIKEGTRSLQEMLEKIKPFIKEEKTKSPVLDDKYGSYSNFCNDIKGGW